MTQKYYVNESFMIQDLILSCESLADSKEANLKKKQFAQKKQISEFKYVIYYRINNDEEKYITMITTVSL